MACVYQCLQENLITLVENERGTWTASASFRSARPSPSTEGTLLAKVRVASIIFCKTDSDDSGDENHFQCESHRASRLARLDYAVYSG